MSSDDIVTLLLQDHNETRLQLEIFADSDRTEWAARFSRLADSLVRHEVGEEVVLYPVLRMEPGGCAIADARLAEQSEVADVLSQMERADPLGAEFAEAFDTLRSVVLEHAGSEELFVFPLLRQLDQDGLLLEMGRRYREIKDSPSPTQQPSDVKQLAALIRQKAPEVTRASLSPIHPGSNGAHDTDNTPSPVGRVGTALIT